MAFVIVISLSLSTNCLKMAQNDKKNIHVRYSHSQITEKTSKDFQCQRKELFLRNINVIIFFAETSVRTNEKAEICSHHTNFHALMYTRPNYVYMYAYFSCRMVVNINLKGTFIIHAEG